jgi:hypothetical protein
MIHRKNSTKQPSHGQQFAGGFLLLIYSISLLSPSGADMPRDIRLLAAFLAPIVQTSEAAYASFVEQLCCLFRSRLCNIGKIQAGTCPPGGSFGELDLQDFASAYDGIAELHIFYDVPLSSREMFERVPSFLKLGKRRTAFGEKHVG